LEVAEAGWRVGVLGAWEEWGLDDVGSSKYDCYSCYRCSCLHTLIEIWNIVWPFAIGGCWLDRPIVEILMKLGDWEVVELETDGEP
jgi:hypothetical protein